MNATLTQSTETITKENYGELVLNAGKPVLLQFWAGWCVPCMLMKRTVAKVSESMGNDVTVGLINIDEEPELVARHGIRGTPTFVVLAEGRVRETFSGVFTAAGLARNVKRIIG